MINSTATKFTTNLLKNYIAAYFQKNPGCITSQYDPADVQEAKLNDLEKTLEYQASWIRVEKHKDDGKIFRCFVPRLEILEAHGYSDGDEVKVYIWTDLTDTKIVDFSLELH